MKFVRTFTGCRSANESATRSASLFVIVWLVQLRNIRGRFVNPPVQHPVVNIFVLHSETTFWCFESGQRIMVPEDLLFLDPGCGTSCLCLFVNYMTNRYNLKRHSKHFLCSSSVRFCGFISEVALYQIFITITITLIRWFVDSLIRSFVHSSIRPFVRSFVQSLVRSFVLSFVRSFVRFFVRSFFRSFVRTFDRCLCYLC